VRASDLPLSILIVGVGGADFSQMEVYQLYHHLIFARLKFNYLESIYIYICVRYLTSSLAAGP
jgi:hypothetical protein